MRLELICRFAAFHAIINYQKNKQEDFRVKIDDASVFLQEHVHDKISTGKSGADVYAVGGDMLLKHARCGEIPDPTVWDSYVREAQMYAWFHEKHISWVPELLYEHRTPQEVILLLRRYRMLTHEEAACRLSEIIKMLACVHSLPAPDFLDTPKRSYTALPPERLRECLEGWKSVLAEHGHRFDAKGAAFVAEYFNLVNEYFYPQNFTLIHGDFHCDNLLMDGHGALFICDWQNASIGTPASDIAFFLSRLSADGISLDADALIESYCAAAAVAGAPAGAKTLRCDMTLSSLNTAFLFWYQYLHENPPERVGSVFYKMVADMDWLLGKLEKKINGRFHL